MILSEIDFSHPRHGTTLKADSDDIEGLTLTTATTLSGNSLTLVLIPANNQRTVASLFSISFR